MDDYPIIPIILSHSKILLFSNWYSLNRMNLTFEIESDLRKNKSDYLSYQFIDKNMIFGK